MSTVIKFLVVVIFSLGLNAPSSSFGNSWFNLIGAPLQYSHNNETNIAGSRVFAFTGFEDGRYCARVEYYNPRTGTRSIYTLNVEVEDGKLSVIYWPNGGWLDSTHFDPPDITNGKCVFITDRGYQYKVTLGLVGGC